MPAAAQSLWDQVAATDFTARVPLLAQEAAAAKPAVIGIQEATTWECRPSATSAPTVVYDFTAQFLEATAKAGTPYVLEPGGKVTVGDTSPLYPLPTEPPPAFLSPS
jgi:hypothetical protein